MTYKLTIRERGLNMAWRIISTPRIYRYARKFDINSIFAFRLSGPDEIWVEPTNHCNLRCIMCGRTYFAQPWGYMDFELYKKLVEGVRVPVWMVHAGFGEPLLHPNIVGMIRYSVKRGMKTHITTNGMLLTADMSRELIKAGLDEIMISLDGARKQTFEKIRPGANFETLIRNIEDLARLRRETGGRKPQIVIAPTPMKSNLKEIPEIARMASEMGLDKVEIHRFEMASRTEGEPSIPPICIDEDPFKPELKDALSMAFSELDEIARSTGLRINKPPESGDILLRSPRRCPMPYTYPLVTFQGYVMPCFCFGDPREINMGNIKDKPFYVIWNDKPFREFRDALLSSVPHPRCVRCRIFQGINNLWTDYKEL